MKNLSLFKKIRIFNQYRKALKSNEKELEQKFNLRIDRAKRLYTVINIPEEIIGEPYNLRKSDIDKIAENFIKEYSLETSKYLDSIGIKELYEYYKIEKVEKYSYLLIIGFSLFRSEKYYDNLYYKVIPATILVGIILALIFIL